MKRDQLVVFAIIPFFLSLTSFSRLADKPRTNTLDEFTPPIESIESQTELSLQTHNLGLSSFPPGDSALTPILKSVAGNVIRVQLIVYNPIFKGSSPLSESTEPGVHWLSNTEIVSYTSDFMNGLNTYSGGTVEFHYHNYVQVKQFPPRHGGTLFTDANYEDCFLYFQDKKTLPDDQLKTICEQPVDDSTGFDLKTSLGTAYGGVESACDALASGDADEVWIWAMPGASAYEWYIPELNPADPQKKICPNVSRQFGVLVFNYQRGASEMLEDIAHRTEYTLRNDTSYKVPSSIRDK